MSVTFKNRGSTVSSTTGTISPAPNATTEPDASNMSVMAIGTKPDTATVDTPTDWTLLFSVTGGTGVTGLQTGPTRLTVFFREGAFSGAQAVTLTSNNVSWGSIYTYIRSLAGWETPAFTTGDDTTGGSDAFSATGLADPGWVTGDLMYTAGVVPTSDHTAVGALSLNATGITGGTNSDAVGVDVTGGNAIGGIIFHRVGATGPATSPPTLGTTFTGATNTYGPAGFVRLRDVVGILVPRVTVVAG